MANRIEDITAVTRVSAVQNLQLAADIHTPKGALAVGDKAELSLTAQARLLKDRGASVDEIASQLGLTVAIVEGDLGVPRDTSPSQLITK
jgi:ABC-type phosphonate transport system ATPase subunit